MSVETAKSIVDYELKNFADFEGIEFDLFGGEPFLAFDLVREITDYIQRNEALGHLKSRGLVDHWVALHGFINGL